MLASTAGPSDAFALGFQTGQIYPSGWSLTFSWENVGTALWEAAPYVGGTAVAGGGAYYAAGALSSGGGAASGGPIETISAPPPLYVQAGNYFYNDYYRFVYNVNPSDREEIFMKYANVALDVALAKGGIGQLGQLSDWIRFGPTVVSNQLVKYPGAKGASVVRAIKGGGRNSITGFELPFHYHIGKYNWYKPWLWFKNTPIL